jgi:hypothetical protein
MLEIPRIYLYFDTTSDDKPENRTTEKDQSREQEDKNIYCAICGFPLTTVNERFAMNGACEHTFTNPHGYVYTIICFRSAPGVLHAGEETEEFTWFKGYSWCYGLCRQCTSHLGWIYIAKNSNRFYGLIKERLSRESSLH